MRARYDDIWEMELTTVRKDATLKAGVVDRLPEFLGRLANEDHQHNVAPLGRLVRVLAGL